MDGKLKSISSTPHCNMYEVNGLGSERVRKFIASTPQTRSICNDPFNTGIRYTRDLRDACAYTLKALHGAHAFTGTERTTSIFHILRGGLNFGLREALAIAFGWNDHPSAFISAQRARKSDNPEDWFITEGSYKKVHLCKVNNIVFGDVVATGTSLEYALQQMGEIASEQNVEISSILFFTIGGPRSHEILENVDAEYRKRFKSYTGATVVYFEGIFAVADKTTDMSIKIDGTDLVRTNSLLAPEFVESQYESPTYPLERCTIYDAGSRSFDIIEYLEDLADYWSKTLELAKRGMTFEELLRERMPELEAERFRTVDLNKLATQQLTKCHTLLSDPLIA